MLFWSRAADPDARYLSNFQSCPFTLDADFPVVCLRGLTFPSVEHAFQAAKVGFSSGDPSSKLEELRSPISAVLAKRAGTRAAWARAGLILDTETWQEACEDVMERLVQARARVDPRFVDIARGADTLYHYDRFGLFWGGRWSKDNVWIGQNRLGEIIARVCK